MLEQAGVSRMQSDSDFRGPTNMHNLLELVKKEQDIYNIVFHELIRQVAIKLHECCIRYTVYLSYTMYIPCVYHVYTMYIMYIYVCTIG